MPDHWNYLRSQGQDVPKFERARWHMENFPFTVTPYSLHEFNSISRKLVMMQAKKTGFPIDWWTEAEMYDLKNFGPPPKFTDPETGDIREAQTVLERWICQMEMMARMQAGQGGGQQKKGRGRPGSGQQPPTLEAKRGGTDSVVRESKHAQ